MAQFTRQVITSLRGGICTLPAVDRRASECEDSWNILFSNTHGAYRRPGTEIIGNKIDLQPACEIDPETGNARIIQKPENEEDLRYGNRAMFVFPVKKYIYQVLLLGSGVWGQFFIDFEKERNIILNDFPEDIEACPNPNRNNQMILKGSNHQLIYSNKCKRPQKVFRCIKAEGRLWILNKENKVNFTTLRACLLYTSPSPRDS